MSEKEILIDSNKLASFIRDIFVKLGVPVDDALAVASNLVAVGMHHASAREEKIAKLGAAVVRRYRVIDHNAED